MNGVWLAPIGWIELKEFMNFWNYLHFTDVTNENDRGRGSVCDGECDHG